MKRLGLALLALLLSVTAAAAQIPGNFPAGTVFGNSSAAARPGRTETFTAMLDRAFCSTNPSLLARTGSWACTGVGTGVLTALAVNVGSAGAFVTFNGAGGTPSSLTLTNATGLPISTGVSGLGAGCATFLSTPSSGNLRGCVTDETGSGGGLVFATSPTLTTPVLGAATATSINGNTLTTGTWTVTGGSAKTLTFNNTITLSGTDGTTWTGASTSMTLAALNIQGQTLAGGATVTSLSQSTGNITVDCGARPLQYITNGGAYTITAPAADGSCILLSTNNASAGAITFSGFSVGSSTGDSLTTTNGHKFSIMVWRINGTSGYRIAAHQ